MSKSKKVLVLMSGSIACYKACGLISKMVQAGMDVQVVASASAQKFVGNATIEGLTGKPLLSDLFQSDHIMDHIYLVREADLVIAVPATANLINKMAAGVGDDLLSTIFLAHDFNKPFLLAPAMNTKMYQHPVTQGSLEKLKKMGVEILETASGVLACGEVGWGKLLDPELIFAEVSKHFEKYLSVQNNRQNKQNGEIKNQRISGRSLRVLITSGGTSEPIDAVRVITNTSTGKTGAQLADVLHSLGMQVTLLKAYKAIAPVSDIDKLLEFSSYADLAKTLQSELKANSYDFIFHAAAVSDYSLAKGSVQGKISSDKSVMTLKLKRNPKLIDQLKKWSRNKKMKVIGFKMTAFKNSTVSKVVDINGEVNSKTAHQKTILQKNSQQRKAVEKLFQHSKADLVIQNDVGEISSLKHTFHLFSNVNNKIVEISSVDGVLALTSEISKWMVI